MYDREGEWKWVAAIVLIVVTLLVGFKWYRAAVQRDVYERAGIQMSTWEVFIGARPAERSVTIKEREER